MMLQAIGAIIGATNEHNEYPLLNITKFKWSIRMCGRDADTMWNCVWHYQTHELPTLFFKFQTELKDSLRWCFTESKESVQSYTKK